MATVEELRLKLAEAELALHKALTAAQMTDVSRDGRRIRWSPTKPEDLRSYIADLKAQIAVLDPAGAEAGQRRRAIGVRF